MGSGDAPYDWKGDPFLYHDRSIMWGEGLSDELCGIHAYCGGWLTALRRVADCIAANSVSWLLLVGKEGRVWFGSMVVAQWGCIGSVLSVHVPYPMELCLVVTYQRREEGLG